MSIVVVGSVAFDDITSPSGSVKGILGGAATYFSLAASCFTQVRMVAVVGEDFSPEHENVLKKRGVDTRGIERAAGKTFRWGGSYAENLNESQNQFHRSECISRSFSRGFPRSTKTRSFFSWRTFSRPCRPMSAVR